MNRAAKGFSLVDVIVGVALMLTLFLSLFGVLRASLTLSSLAKAKSTGVELANTQMEYLHGLAYDSVGTLNGIPTGIVAQNATTTIDGVAYTVHTYIQYTDDNADGAGISDTNNVPTDYKVGKVTVFYTIYGLTKSVVLVSNFFPPGIESTTGGGTLSLRVVNKDNVGVPSATVQIINASTTPPINFSTVSDTDGYVIIGGAATSSQFQIYVSRGGYSSAQTYARTGQNANPTPGYLTVVKNQTTSATFAIDLLSSLVLSTFSPASTTAWSDTFVSPALLANQSNTQVSGGAVILTPDSFAGTAESVALAPSYLDGWGVLQASLSAPSGTSVVVHVSDAGGTLVPDAVLAGNNAGFASFPVSLTAISTTTYPSLSLKAELATNATTTIVSLLDWSLSYTAGPVPLPATAFTLTGAKTIGTTAGGAVIYKTIMNDTTSSSGSKNVSLEWDAYTPTISSLIDSCPVSPYALPPATTLPVVTLVGTLSTNTLPVLVTNSGGGVIPSAKVVLTKSGYAATLATNACGGTYFNGLSSGTYTATVSATGYATTAFPNISVSGTMPTQTFILP